MTLSDILPELRRWLENINLSAQVLTDTDDALRVIFETESAVAELIAGDGAYAPYRFVSFAVLDMQEELNAAPVFCYYDNEHSTMDDILCGLKLGLRYLEKA